MVITRYLPESNYLKIIQWLTAAIGFLPIIPYNVSSITMITWILILVLYPFLYKKQLHLRNSRFWVPFWFLTGNFFIFVISMVYTSDIREGLRFIESSLVMLILPLGFLIMSKLPIDTSVTVRYSTQVFWISTSLLCLYLLWSFYRLGHFSRFSEVNSFNSIFRDTADHLTRKHPTYLSLYFGFAMYLTCEKFARRKGFFLNILYGVILGILVVVVLLMASRTPIIAVIVSFLVVYFFKIRKKWLKAVFFIGFIIVSVLVVRLTPAIYSRVTEVSNTAFEPPVGVHHNSTNIRVGIIKCSLDIIKNNIWIGVGAGDDRTNLLNCYKRYPTDAYEIHFYNTHNQYLNILLLTGVFSLIFFIGTLFLIIKDSFHNKDFVLLFFIVLLCVGFITENLLSRQAGIVFFYYFVCLRVLFNRSI